MEFASPVRKLPFQCALLVFLMIAFNVSVLLMALRFRPVDWKTFWPCYTYEIVMSSHYL